MGSMRGLLSTVLALCCAALLSSCTLLPFGVLSDDDQQQADAVMTNIAAAVSSQDAGALKALFSKRALEKATDLDARIDNFLTSFPSGFTWKSDGAISEAPVEHGLKTKVLQASYTVSADGKDYRLFFADFTVNEIYDKVKRPRFLAAPMRVAALG